MFDQEACPFCRRLRFWRRIAFDLEEWINERDLKLDLFAAKRRLTGQSRDLSKRAGKLLDGLNQC
ncbi:hypothetical protein ACRQ5Q_41985 (plasmid) [Bradyrhizobium sp. PMVTL-01]|uniref:hypothetical protein n=1 Tax=Bradyrhizobium sp. PMVTL-01 TaxID=3434999 RepID=UPI003F703E6C